MSDKLNASTDNPFGYSVQYGGDFEGATHKGDWERDSWITREAKSYLIIYKNPTGDFIIRITDAREKWSQTKIFCEQDII